MTDVIIFVIVVFVFSLLYQSTGARREGNDRGVSPKAVVSSIITTVVASVVYIVFS